MKIRLALILSLFLLFSVAVVEKTNAATLGIKATVVSPRCLPNGDVLFRVKVRNYTGRASVSRAVGYGNYFFDDGPNYLKTYDMYGVRLSKGKSGHITVMATRRQVIILNRQFTATQLCTAGTI